ncbi:ATP-dependent RNA helicase dhx29-like [Antedon mediterranea]|uniref:ATP-dependent RNA helicase dhx29-like n=1 Tax=Antedon mediterranea TaxID=105859 RepID=UPI003AF8B71D
MGGNKKRAKPPKPIASESIESKKKQDVPKKYAFDSPSLDGKDEDKSILKVKLPSGIEKEIISEILRLKESQDAKKLSSRVTAKKLTDFYNSLSNVGFQHNHISDAMSHVIKNGGDLHDALDWLCLNLNDALLPQGFSAEYMVVEEKHKPKPKVENDDGERKEQEKKQKEEALKKEQQLKQERKSDTNVTMKDWILKYAEDYDDDSDEDMVNSENIEDNITDPNERYIEIRAKLWDAKEEAIAAKQAKDQSAKKTIGKKIKQLKDEMCEIEKMEGFDNRLKEEQNQGGGTNNPENAQTVNQINKQVGKEKDGKVDEKDGKVDEKDGKVDEKDGKIDEDEDIGAFALFAAAEETADAVATTESPKTNHSEEKRPTLDVRDFAYTRQQWTGKSPKQFLIDWCRKNLPKSPPPKYEKISCSKGRWKSRVKIDRKADGILSVCPDILTENSMDAQHLASVLAMWNLCPGQSIHQLLPPPYRNVWLEWRDAEMKSKQESKQEKNKPRDDFVAKLVKQLKTVKITEDSMDTEFEEVEQSWEDREQSWEDREQSWEDRDWNDDLPISNEVKKMTKVSHARLCNIYQSRQRSEEFQRLLHTRQSLPVFEYKHAILERIASNPVVVIAGETGCGKSTQVPHYILEHLLLGDSKAGLRSIVCTQPRRISASSLARRVSEEIGENEPGSKDSLCGYQIRLDSKQTSTTRLLYCTTGILLRRLQIDPILEEVSHVIVDEVHERSVQSDFLLIHLKKLLRTRSDFKVLLMSATVDSSKISAYFGHCPVVNIPGRTFPVQVLHLEDAIERTGYNLDEDSPYALRRTTVEGQANVKVTGKAGHVSNVKLAWEKEDSSNIDMSGLSSDMFGKRTRHAVSYLNPDRINMDLILELLKSFETDSEYSSIEGAVLIFLPGLANIQELYEILQSHKLFSNPTKYTVLGLHSVLSSQDQTLAFKTSPSGVRKIVLATNIAETGITIPDVVFVIDAGKVKETRYLEGSQMSVLEETFISKASAKQRQGRAGRVRSGFCFRLYTHEKYNSLKSYTIPEILRVPLEELCLHIMECKLGQPDEFLKQALDPPQGSSIRAAMSLLQEIGACSSDQPSLTALGHHLAALPVHVRIGKMLLFGAILGCLEPVAIVAAAMTDKSPFVVPLEKRGEANAAKRALAIANSDHITIFKVYSGWQEARTRGRKEEHQYCQRNFLSRTSLLNIENVKNDLMKLIKSIGFLDNSTGRTSQTSSAASFTESGVLEISKSQSAWQKNSFKLTTENIQLLKSVLTAGLYPNVAKINFKPSVNPLDKDEKLAMVDTAKGGAVLHPASVNKKIACHGWMVFLEKVKQSRVFLRDSTLISPYHLLLFGGGLSIQHRERIVSVDGWIQFKAFAKTAVIFKQLRELLDVILIKKLQNPQYDIHNEKIIQLLISLIQAER